MAGIAGVVYPDVLLMNDLVRPMLNTLEHRGGSGERDAHIFKNIQIGVIGQTFSFNQRRTVLAGIDGSLVNASDLREELMKRGFHFQGQTTAEIIVHGYEYWDTALFDHLSGEFSIVLFDQQKKRILLCRDRIGIKPLYWFQNNKYFFFASELKALLATGLVPQTPALDALSSYLYFGFIPQDMAPISGVNKLLPAHYIELHFDGSKRIVSYWSYSSFFQKQISSPLPEIIRELDDLLRESLRTSCSNNGTIGCLMTGELGSATIASYAAKSFPKENTTAFTIDCLHQKDEDVANGIALAKQLGIAHSASCISSENFLDDLVKISWFLDEPLASPNCITTWNFCALASKKTATVVSSIGSDELFTGNVRYSLAKQRYKGMQRALHKMLSCVQKLLLPILIVAYKPLAYTLLKQKKANRLQYDYLQQTALMSEAEIVSASPRLAGIFDPEVFLHKFHHLKRMQSNVASYLYFDVKTRLPDELLIQYERLTAAHSLALSVPFLNKKIVEFLAQLPNPDYLEQADIASYLKALARKEIPQSFIQKPRRARKNTYKQWLTTEAMKKHFALLLEGSLVETGMIFRPWIEAKLKELPRSPDGFKHLFAVLMLEIWFRLFINRPILSYPPEMTVEQLLKEPS